MFRCELGMSKKTLYQHVTDKTDLVKKVVESYLDNDRNDCWDIVNNALNPIDHLLRVSAHFSQEMRNHNPAMIFDLKKYYPECWNIFNQHRDNFIYTQVYDNIVNGMKLGYFRQDMNPEIITRLYIGMVDLILEADLFPPNKYHFTDLHQEMMHYHIRGMATPAGLAYLQTQLQ